MKTIVKDEILSTGKRWSGDGYLIGSIGKNNLSALNREGYDLKMGTLAGYFDGLNTFIDVMTNQYGKFGTRKPRSDDSSQSERGSHWTKFSTFKEGVDKMRNDPSVFRNFTEADIMLRDEANAGIDVEYGVSGDYLDIDRVLTGEPEAFGIMKNGKIIQQFCSVIINGNHSAGVEQETIDYQAQRVLRLIDMLESNNVRCEVGIVFTNTNSHSEIRLKHYEDLLDIDDLAVALSPDFFRRLQFVFTEHSKTRQSGYGTADRLGLSAMKDPDATFTIAVDNNFSSKWKVEEGFDQLEKDIEADGLDKDYLVLG